MDTTKGDIVPEMNDWSILNRDGSVQDVTPNAVHDDYDLFNLTDHECLVYGHRPGNNINLRWGDPGQSDNVRFVREDGGSGPLTYGAKVGIHIRGGDWLRYQSGRWGINLGWSGSPVFEWVFEGGAAGAAVQTGTPLALYNTVEQDYLFYEPRDWGINLKWLKDSGKYAEITGLIRAGKDLKSVYQHL